MSSIGFKGFAKPKTVDQEAQKGMLGNVSSDEFIYWTGNQYGRRRASGRSAALNTITEKGKPIALSTYVSRALKAGPDGKGYDTSISVGGLSLHQGAKPAVYLYLVKDAAGNMRAKKSIPNVDPAFSAKPFAAGDIVIAAKAKALAKPKGQEVAKK